MNNLLLVLLLPNLLALYIGLVILVVIGIINAIKDIKAKKQRNEGSNNEKK